MLPRPNFNEQSTLQDVKRYLVMLVEEIEKEMEVIKDGESEQQI